MRRAGGGLVEQTLHTARVDAEAGLAAAPEPAESEVSRRKGLMVVETAMELAGARGRGVMP